MDARVEVFERLCASARATCDDPLVALADFGIDEHTANALVGIFSTVPEMKGVPLATVSTALLTGLLIGLTMGAEERVDRTLRGRPKRGYDETLHALHSVALTDDDEIGPRLERAGFDHEAVSVWAHGIAADPETQDFAWPIRTAAAFVLGFVSALELAGVS